MNPENNFEELRTLLRCKRYEKPPPGYFEFFSAKVIGQLQQEKEIPLNWWQRLAERFDAKPVLACAYSFAVSGLLLLGFQMSESFDREAQDISTPVNGWLATSGGGAHLLRPEPTVEPGLTPFQAPLWRGQPELSRRASDLLPAPGGAYPNRFQGGSSFILTSQ